MKTGRLPDSKTVKPSRRSCLKPRSTENSTKKTNRLIHKARGSGEELLDEDQRSPFKEVANKDTILTEKEATVELYPGQTLVSSPKIKLQLFPINNGTRIGLEKDGHNPYLELTLRGQKKISSVLKHLQKKWGSSSIAMGELMLFPYSVMDNLSNCRRWTMGDGDITAAVVYAAVGSPKIFRLRYGWFCSHKPRSFEMPFTSDPVEAGVQPDGIQGGCNTSIETSYDEGGNVEVASKEYKAIDTGDTTNAIVAQKLDNVSIDPLDNEPKTNSGLGQSSLLWFDSLTNISIGGLLSEASLQGKISNFDTRSHGSNAGTQPSNIIPDSLDAFIAAQIRHPQVSGQSTENLRTSILDAEETCHAFPLKKFSTPGKDVLNVSGKACNHDVSSNSIKMPNADKVNDQEGLPQDPASWKAETDLLLSFRPYDDDRSLGLTGINWNDSLGPFDLGMPAQKVIEGDSLSIGRFVR